MNRVARALGVVRAVVNAVALSFAACVPIETEWTQKDGETFPPFDFRTPPPPDAYGDYDYSDSDGYWYADYSDYYGDYYDGYYWEDTSYYYDDTTDGYYYYYWTYPHYYNWSYWYYSDYYGHYGGSDGPTHTLPDSGGSAF